MTRKSAVIFVPSEPADEEQEFELMQDPHGQPTRRVFVSVDDDRVMILNENNAIVWKSASPDVIDFARTLAEHIRGEDLTP